MSNGFAYVWMVVGIALFLGFGLSAGDFLRSIRHQDERRDDLEQVSYQRRRPWLKTWLEWLLFGILFGSWKRYPDPWEENDKVWKQ